MVNLLSSTYEFSVVSFMHTERIIIGIDPGLATVGYSILRVFDDHSEIMDFGVIETPSEMEFSERLVMIQQDLDKLIKKYHPTESYVEDLFFSANTKTALSVAHARGVIMAGLSVHGLDPQSVTPNQVKKTVTGDGSADKRQIQDMVRRHFSLKSLPKPDDAADALAVALYGAICSCRI